MRITIILFFFTSLIGCNTVKQNSSTAKSENDISISLDDYCSANPCRTNTTVKFLTENGKVNEFLEKYWPVVQGDQISLLPGEKVYIEATMDNGRFINFKQVQVINNPEKTIIFDFQQMEDKVDMTLTVKNPFSKIMKYNINMLDFEGAPHQTSSCPVIAGGSVYEMWPHAIGEIIVSNFRSLPASDTMSCVY